MESSPTGFVSCCVDASFITGSGRTGWGMCIRNDRGEFVAARMSWSTLCLPVIEVETLGLLHALSWMRDYAYEKVCFEHDYKMVVDKFHSPGADVFELGSITQQCSRNLSTFPNFMVKFIRRQANTVAHCLARAALSRSSPHIYH